MIACELPALLASGYHGEVGDQAFAWCSCHPGLHAAYGRWLHTCCYLTRSLERPCRRCVVGTGDNPRGGGSNKFNAGPVRRTTAPRTYARRHFVQSVQHTPPCPMKHMPLLLPLRERSHRTPANLTGHRAGARVRSPQPAVRPLQIHNK